MNSDLRAYRNKKSSTNKWGNIKTLSSCVSSKNVLINPLQQKIITMKTNEEQIVELI